MFPRPHHGRRLAVFEGGAGVAERKSLWLPLSIPPLPALGTQVGEKEWLALLDAATHCDDAWFTDRVGVVRVPAGNAPDTIAAFATHGVALGDDATALALDRALDAPPALIAGAPGVLFAHALIVPTVLRLPADGIIAGAALALAVGATPLLVHRRDAPHFDVAALALGAAGGDEEEEEEEEDADELSTAQADLLDRTLRAHGQDSVAPPPRQLAEIARAFAALARVGAEMGTS
jgi:hypothetical protein